MATSTPSSGNDNAADKDVPGSRLRLYSIDNLQLTDPALSQRVSGDAYQMLSAWIKQLIHIDSVSPDAVKTLAASVPGLNVVFSLYDIVHDVRTLASFDEGRRKMGYEVFPNWLDTALDVIGLLPMPPVKTASMGLKTAMRMAFDPKVAANLLEQHLVAKSMGMVLDELDVIANRHITSWVDQVNGGYVKVINGAQQAVQIAAHQPGVWLLDNVYRQFDKGGKTATGRFHNLLETTKATGPKAIREALLTGNSEFEGLKSLLQHFVRLHRPKYGKAAGGGKPADKPAKPIVATGENGHERKFHNATTGRVNVNEKPQNLQLATKANANLPTAGTAGPDCCPKNSTPEGKRNTTRKPVHLATGEEILYQTDFTTPGIVPVTWTRCYRSSHAAYDKSPLGARWTSPYTTAITQTADGFIYHDATGRNVRLPLLAIGECRDIPFESFELRRDSASVISIVYRNGDHDEFRSGRQPLRDDEGNIRYALQAKHSKAGPVLHTLSLQETRVRFASHPAIALLAPNALLIVTDGHQLWLECLPAGSEHFASDSLAAKRITSDLAALHDANRKAGIAGITGDANTQPDAWATQLATHIGRIDQLLSDGSKHTHVHYRYAPACDEQATPLGTQAGLDLVEQRDAENNARCYAYASHLLTRYTDYKGFGCNLTWRTDPAWAPFPERCVRTVGDDGSDDTRLDYDPAFNETTVTDAAGVRKIYTYNHLNLITGVETVLPDGSRPWSQNIWDKDGNLVKNIDPEGRTTRYRYDVLGNLLAVTAPDGAITRYEYDADNNPVAIIDPAGQTWKREFDAHGNLIRQVDPADLASAYQYDELGQLISATDAKGGTTRFAYNELGQLVAQTDCSSKTTRYSYNQLGHLVASTDAAGNITRYETDRLGRVRSVLRADGSKESFQYDAADKLTASTDANGAVTRFGYNGEGQLTTRIDANGHSLSWQYNRNLQLARLVNQNGESYDFRYDEQGRLIAETGFDGKTTTYAYDDGGRLIASQTGKIRSDYLRDDAGRLLEKRVHQPTGGGPVVHTTRYQYDALDNLIWVKNHDSETHFTYNEVGHLVGETQHVRLKHGARTIERVFTLKHEVDELGNRIETTLPNGRKVGIQRYGSGHWIGTLWNGTPIADIERDDLHREKVRLLGRAASPQQRLAQTRSYDPLSRLKSLKLTGPGHELLSARNHAYDAAGNLLQIEDLHRDKIRYQYDPVGQLLKAVQPDLTEHFSFDPAGNLTDGKPQRTKQANTAGIDHAHWEQGLDHLTEQPQGEARPKIAPVTHNLLKSYLNMDFDHDEQGNTIRKVVKGADGEKPHVLNLHYDAENRLVKAIRPGSNQTMEAEYRYDAFGRRVAKLVRTLKQAKATGTYGGTGRMETVDEAVTFFVWDGDTMVQEVHPDSTVTYLFEPESFVPMAQVHSDVADSLYDPEVVKRKSSGDEQQRAAEELERENLKWLKVTDANAYRIAIEVIEQRKQQAAIEARTRLEGDAEADRIYFINTDHLGTPQEATSEDGKVVWLAKYKAWGGVRSLDKDDITQPWRFQGQYEDEETGLFYNRHRYYDPDTARYLAQDPIGLMASSNFYAYAPNSTGWIDPLGLSKSQGVTCSSTCKCPPQSKSTALAPYWPPNRGVLGKAETITLQPGTRIDRYGYEGGTFVSPAGTPYPARALPPGTDKKPYNIYEVVKPIENVQAGKVAPWFGEFGCGTQYELPSPVADLRESGHLKKVN